MVTKVAVFDDKPLILRSLVEMVKWDELHCELVASAEDGIEGKKIIEQHMPDLIVTDIRMPGADGLELAEYAMNVNPMSKVIIISGYQEFEYAKKSVQLGVFDYIVKPIDYGELTEVVRKAVNDLKLVRESEQEKEYILPSAIKQFASDILMGLGSEDSSKSYQSQLDAHYYAMFIMRDMSSPIYGHQEVNRVQFPDAAQLWLEKLKREDQVDVLQLQLVHDWAVVFMFKEVRTRNNIEQWIARRSHELTSLLRKQTDILFGTEWSEPVRQFPQLRLQYVEMMKRFPLQFFQSSDDEYVSDEVKFSVLRDLEQFSNIIKHASMEEQADAISKMLKRIAVYAAGHIAVAKLLISELCLSVVKHYYKQYQNEWVFEKSVDEMLKDIHQLGSLEQADAYLQDLLLRFKNHEQEKRRAYSSMVREILTYIEEHYREDISLSTLSEHFQVSSGHISRLLRKETGTRFVDIVTRTRLDAAKRLMSDPSRRIQEISEMTGFKNYMYFYQVFKKYEKMSPQAYQKKN